LSSVGGIVERLDPLRDALRGRIAAIHRATKPALGEDEAAPAAVIVNQVMKTVPALATTEDERAERLVGEARKLMAQYIAEVLGRPSAGPPSLGAQAALGRGWPSALARRVKPEQY
jgi:hypothetical protein